MDENLSLKTIFILDCSQKYQDTNSGQKYDIGLKTTSTSSIISKSLYTCSVEAVFEYSRIVWDLFPNGERSLLFISCSPNSTYSLNKWDPSQQNCENLLNSFMKLTHNSAQTSKKKVNNSKLFLIDGFKQALVHFSLELGSNKNGIQNLKTNIAGRIIIITYENENENFIKNFQNEILKEFTIYNQKSAIPISNLDVILINSFPINIENVLLKNIPRHQLSDELKFSLYSVASSSILAARLTSMAFEHYDLASTTVCNIPMKEEQNSGTSYNYDVEIIHSRKAHSQFFQNAFSGDVDSLYQNVDREKQKYKSLKLKWCTPPKNNTLEMSYCIGVYRITAIDVSSRPSSCLINFLHTGKTVILEIPKKSTSHMLRCHNGELFIHVLTINQPLIEDAPSISEGVGGRTTDYRINDFAELMKKNHLTLKSNVDDEIDCLEQSDFTLKKQTIYWPISFGLTVFFNIRDQFYQLITKEKLSDTDSIALRDIIYHHLQYEKTGVTIPMQSNIIRCKGLKKEDLYKIFWNEMEHIIRCYNVSAQHQKILQCYLDIKPKNDNSNSNYPFQMINNNDDTLGNNFAKDQSHQNNNNYYYDKSRNQNIVATTEINYNRIKASLESLKDIFTAKLEAKRKKLPDFVGRSVKVAKLYAGLNEDK